MPANCCSRRARSWSSAGNATYGTAERKDLAEQLEQIRDQLLSDRQPLRRRGHLPVRRPGLDRAAVRRFASATSATAPEQTGVRYVGSAGNSMTDQPTAICRWRSTARRSGPPRAPATAFSRLAPASSNAGAWIDAGQVADPSALTGDSYSLVFDAATQSFDITNIDNRCGAGARSPMYRAARSSATAWLRDDQRRRRPTARPSESCRRRRGSTSSAALDKAVADLSRGPRRAGLSAGRQRQPAQRGFGAGQPAGGARAQRRGAGAHRQRSPTSWPTEKLHHQSERSAPKIST